MARAILRVDGMRCDRCATAVGAALRSLQGVRRAEIPPGVNRAEVEWDERLTAIERIIERVEQEGYGATALR